MYRETSAAIINENTYNSDYNVYGWYDKPNATENYFWSWDVKRHNPVRELETEEWEMPEFLGSSYQIWYDNIYRVKKNYGYKYKWGG